MNKTSRINIINRLHNIILVIIVLITILIVELDLTKVTTPKPEKAFIIIGVFVTYIGVFGYLKNEVALGRIQTIKYDGSSIIGKGINVIICVIGLGLIVFGCINII